MAKSVDRYDVVPGEHLLLLDDTELQALAEAVKRAQPYRDLPGLARATINLEHTLDDEVRKLIADTKAG